MSNDEVERSVWKDIVFHILEIPTPADGGPSDEQCKVLSDQVADAIMEQLRFDRAESA